MQNNLKCLYLVVFSLEKLDPFSVEWSGEKKEEGRANLSLLYKGICCQVSISKSFLETVYVYQRYINISRPFMSNSIQENILSPIP